MPNWCNNYLEVTGPMAELEKLLAAVTSNEEGVGLCSHVLPLSEDAGVGDAAETWGTKWDINDADAHVIQREGDTGLLEVDFMSAWAPPVGVYEALCNQGFEVWAGYHEPGMCICGVFEDEEMHEYDYENFDDAEFFRTVDHGIQLDELFGIADELENIDE